MTDYQHLLTQTKDRVATITLNRPEVLNALSPALVREIIDAAVRFDKDPEIGCIVLTGSERAFAAGADISEMQERSFSEMFLEELFPSWTSFENLRTPVIAAVSGFALGGGCELAMMCDFIIAADTAQFGLPEITLGIIPGFGGSQRLPRAIGGAKAAEMILTGRMMHAGEAEQAGLVARVVSTEDLLTESLKTAEVIASKSLPAVYAAREVLRVSQETSLAEGLRFERRAFTAAFATNDQTEGMRAFTEKRPPRFTHR